MIDWIRIIEAFIFHSDPALGGPIGSPLSLLVCGMERLTFSPTSRVLCSNLSSPRYRQKCHFCFDRYNRWYGYGKSLNALSIHAHTPIEQAWRCYVVYRRNLYVIILPSLLIIATTGEIVDRLSLISPAHELKVLFSIHWRHHFASFDRSDWKDHLCDCHALAYNPVCPWTVYKHLFNLYVDFRICLTTLLYNFF